ncbi:MAG: hypothetical protein A2Z11_04685 [Candidatus Woykebacteria bacterium RBG_16_43_9]|uniref:HTH HARE-type domain-containing protein n=1 Tax=Candidatus Woykebacteria bacterium RBG_16_43_9 TaxID=1802596 RepID=A0A1G1WD38_9BACT|nr:MAG: hypothetical protein A2Z11_04685 [Candidatus Woykebacteria bacterium RBG_16_43_9]
MPKRDPVINKAAVIAYLGSRKRHRATILEITAGLARRYPEYFSNHFSGDDEKLYVRVAFILSEHNGRGFRRVRKGLWELEETFEAGER